MSQTTSPEMVDASRWTYVAAVMARALRTRKIDPGSDMARIPRGIYRSTLNFFNMVNEALEAEVPTNPVGSAANYAIAARAARATARKTPKEREEYKEVFRRHTETLRSLDPRQNCDYINSESIEDLAAFFDQIAAEGQAKMAERRGVYDPEYNSQAR